jgi:hypothetical protein
LTLRNSTRSALLALAITSLAGCGSFSSMLGLERHVPDETQVVVRPPLTLPPDYNLMPPGTSSPVSGDHEGAQSMSDAGTPAQPKKEEKGFFGRLFTLDFFSGDSDSDSSKSPAPSIEGTPTPPESTPPEAASAPPPAAEAPMAPVPPKPEERGFFGRIFHGDIFGGDSDSSKPPAQAPLPDVGSAPDQSQKPSGSGAPTTP